MEEDHFRVRRKPVYGFMFESDEIVYRRFLDSGDEDDLRLLLERHRESLTLFIYGYVHSLEDAEELMLDAFAVAALGTSRFSGMSSFKTWLYAIGRNLARKHLRAGHFRMEVLTDEDSSSYCPAPEEELLHSERQRQLYAAMEELPADYRQTLYLLFIEDMSCEDAAQVMRKTKKQVYNLSFRGRQSLKDILERMGFENAGFG